MGEWAYLCKCSLLGYGVPGRNVVVRAGSTIYILSEYSQSRCQPTTSALHRWNGTSWVPLAAPRQGEGYLNPDPGDADYWDSFLYEHHFTVAGYAINGGADLLFLGCCYYESAMTTPYGLSEHTKASPHARVYNIASDTWSEIGPRDRPNPASGDHDSPYCMAGWDPAASRFVVSTHSSRMGQIAPTDALNCTFWLDLEDRKFVSLTDGLPRCLYSFNGATSHAYCGWLSHLNSDTLRCGTTDPTDHDDTAPPQRVYKLGVDEAWTIDASILNAEVGHWVHCSPGEAYYHDSIGVSPIFVKDIYDATQKTYTFRVWKKTPEGEVDFPSAPPHSYAVSVFGDTTGYLFAAGDRLYEWVTTGGGGATTCTITSPAASTTVSGLLEVTGTATDDTELAKVRLYVDGTYIAEQALSGTSADWTLSVNTTLLANGAHNLQAIASDADGNTGSSATVSVTVDNTLQPSDATPPTVTITTPGQAGQSFVDAVAIAALCTDNQALTEARFYIDDVLQSASTQALSGQSAVASATLDISEWSNGSHIVTVRVLDAAGNVGQASITIVVNNLLAEQPKVLYTAEVPVVAYPWRISDHTPRAHKLDVIPSVAPADPRKVYNVYPFVKHRTASGGAIAADYTTYDAITTWQVHPLASDAAALRYALVAKPAFAASYWEVADADEFVRILTCGDRTVALAANPFRIYELDGANLNLLYAFTGSVTFTTLYEAAYADSKLLLATDIGLVAYDFDSEDLPVVIRLSSSSPSTGSVAVLNDTPLVPQGGALYSYTWPSATVLASQSPDGAMCAYKHGTADYLFKATSGDTPSVYAFAASGGASYGGKWNSVYSLTKAVSRIVPTSDGEFWLCCDRQVHRSSPGWTLDGEFASGLVRAVTYWRGRFWCAGTISGLWWRTTNGWAQFNALTGYQVQDLQVVDGALYVAGSYTADSLTRARIMRMQIDEGGDFQSGPTPPDLIGRVVDYADITAQ